jgi:hypothetical protein
MWRNPSVIGGKNRAEGESRTASDMARASPPVERHGQDAHATAADDGALFTFLSAALPRRGGVNFLFPSSLRQVPAPPRVRRYHVGVKIQMVGRAKKPQPLTGGVCRITMASSRVDGLEDNRQMTGRRQ